MSEGFGYPALAKALGAAQIAYGSVKKDKVAKVKTTKGYEYEYRYADLSSVIDAITKALHANELSYSQQTILEENSFKLRTTLIHSSGEMLVSDWPLPLHASPQEMGSALTYARRYSLSAITGIAAEEDDDGQAGNDTKAKNPTKAEVQKELERVKKAPEGAGKPQDGKLTLALPGGGASYHGTMTAFLDAFDTELNSSDDPFGFFDLNSQTLGEMQAKAAAAKNKPGDAIVQRIKEIHDRIHALSNPDNPLRGA